MRAAKAANRGHKNSLYTQTCATRIWTYSYIFQSQKARWSIVSYMLREAPPWCWWRPGWSAANKNGCRKDEIYLHLNPKPSNKKISIYITEQEQHRWGCRWRSGPRAYKAIPNPRNKPQNKSSTAEGVDGGLRGAGVAEAHDHVAFGVESNVVLSGTHPHVTHLPERAHQPPTRTFIGSGCVCQENSPHQPAWNRPFIVSGTSCTYMTSRPPEGADFSFVW